MTYKLSRPPIAQRIMGQQLGFEYKAEAAVPLFKKTCLFLSLVSVQKFPFLSVIPVLRSA